MGTFLHRLWITLAVLASCGWSGLRVRPEGFVEGPRGALVRLPDLHTQGAVAKRPTSRAEAPTGPRFQGQDGHGPDPLPSLPCQPLAWFGPAPVQAVEGPEEGVRVPRGLTPEEGGKRGPPAA